MTPNDPRTFRRDRQSGNDTGPSHTATLLSNWLVLVTGGNSTGVSLAAGELYQ
jgi:hypothetical protein